MESKGLKNVSKTQVMINSVSREPVRRDSLSCAVWKRGVGGNEGHSERCLPPDVIAVVSPFHFRCLVYTCNYCELPLFLQMVVRSSSAIWYYDKIPLK